MAEGETVRVQELTLEAEVTRDAVLLVARDGKADGREVDPDLVSAPGLELHVEQSTLRELLDELEVRHRLARLVGVERPACRVAAIAADRRIDATGSRLWPSTHENGVESVDL